MSKIRVNQITNENVNGAPEFPHGLTTVGVQTVSLGNTSITGNLTINGDANVGGVVTYEDVTSVDSVGIVTARSGLKIGPTAGVGATIFADGSINASGIVTSTNVSVAGSITAGTFYGDGAGLTGVSLHAIEEFAGLCDGTTRTCSFGTFTFPNVSTRQTITTTGTPQDVTGTQITYQPPSGSIGVEVTWTFFNAWSNAGHGIQHFQLLVDGTEILWGRKNTSGQYYERLNTFRWYFRIKNDGSGLNTNDGSMGSWNSTKTIKWRARAYASNDVAKFHYPMYWDGGGGPVGGSDIYFMPLISIIAYGA